MRNRVVGQLRSLASQIYTHALVEQGPAASRSAAAAPGPGSQLSIWASNGLVPTRNVCGLGALANPVLKHSRCGTQPAQLLQLRYFADQVHDRLASSRWHIAGYSEIWSCLLLTVFWYLHHPLLDPVREHTWVQNKPSGIDHWLQFAGAKGKQTGEAPCHVARPALDTHGWCSWHHCCEVLQGHQGAKGEAGLEHALVWC